MFLQLEMKWFLQHGLLSTRLANGLVHPDPLVIPTQPWDDRLSVQGWVHTSDSYFKAISRTDRCNIESAILSIVIFVAITFRCWSVQFSQPIAVQNTICDVWLSTCVSLAARWPRNCICREWWDDTFLAARTCLLPMCNGQRHKLRAHYPW